ncbi:MAG: hypothetical protein GTN69_07050 [Armatimonadetes bacterium]|nr:hypothetical protein [Armatimonadota bacterium]
MDHDTEEIQTGTRTIYGRLVQIGLNDRAEAVAAVQSQGADFLTLVYMSRSDAVQLATNLFTVVRLTGLATWRLGDHAVRSMQLDKIEPFEDGSITEAFDHVRGAAGDAWDGVDPEAYTKRLRREE